MDFIENLLREVEAKFTELSQAEIERQEKAFGKAVDAVMDRYGNRAALIGLINDYPDVLDLSFPIWSRPSTPSEVILASLRQSLTARGRLRWADQEFTKAGSLRTLLANVLTDCVTISRTAPDLVCEVAEQDFEWANDMKHGEFFGVISGIDTLYHGMLDVIVDGELIPGVTEKVGNKVSETIVADLRLVHRLAEMFPTAFVERLRREYSEKDSSHGS